MPVDKCSNYKGLFGMVAFWAIFMALEIHKREDKRCTKQYAIVTAAQVSRGLPPSQQLGG